MVKVVNEEATVSFKFFISVIGLLIALQGLSATWMASQRKAMEDQVAKLEQDVSDLSKQISVARDTYTNINANLAEIKTDILWIRKGLDDHMKSTPVK